jgi:hypothetical protein
MPRFQTVPETFPNIPDWMRRAAQVVNGILLGRTNNTGTFDMTPSATTTTVQNERISDDTVALLEPMTSEAAADHAAGIYQVASAGQIVFTHRNSPNTSRTFRYVLVG